MIPDPCETPVVVSSGVATTPTGSARSIGKSPLRSFPLHCGPQSGYPRCLGSREPNCSHHPPAHRRFPHFRKKNRPHLQGTAKAVRRRRFRPPAPIGLRRGDPINSKSDQKRADQDPHNPQEHLQPCAELFFLGGGYPPLLRHQAFPCGGYGGIGYPFPGGYGRAVIAGLLGRCTAAVARPVPPCW